MLVIIIIIRRGIGAEPGRGNQPGHTELAPINKNVVNADYALGIWR